MAGKRARKPAAAEAAAAAAPSKSFMEESADALAGVEGAFTGSKRKASSPSTASPKKKSPKMNKTETVSRTRSNSIQELAEVAGNLLKDEHPDNKKGAVAAPPVPDPMAVALPVPALPPLPVKANNGTAAAPTGFRKKGAATKAAAAPPPAAAASAAASKAAAAAAAAKAEENKSKKTQITYNPDIPMTKEQLTAWRREMRRVRNRESAAASRRKVRDRIEELEDEVAVWKKRYQEVMMRLGKAEEGKKKKKGGSGGKSEEGGGDDVEV